jgi:hypothetical protein
MIASVGLVLAFTMIATCAVICWAMAANLDHGLFDVGDLSARKVVFATAAILIISAPAFLGFLAARLRRLTWPAIGLAAAVFATVCCWMSHDDAQLRLPPSGEELSPPFEGAAKSYALLMRYSRHADNDEARAFSNITLTVDFSKFAGPRPAARWKPFLTENRGALMGDWAALVRPREWLAELNSFDRIGDLTPARWDADVISFQVWQTLSTRLCAVARLQAIDGRGDEAMATLIPLIEISRKLEPSSRTLIRVQTARLAQLMGLEAASFVLDTTPVGNAARERLASAIAGGDGAGGARRLPLLDGTTYPSFLIGLPFGDKISAVGGPKFFRIPLDALGRVLFNSNATANLYADEIRRLAPLAESRDLSKYKDCEIGFMDDQLNYRGLKNIGGRLILGRTSSLSYGTVTAYWHVEDLRTALAIRLRNT